MTSMGALRFALTSAVALSLAPSGLLACAAVADPALESAKQESEAVFYASMNLGEANALIAEFEKRRSPEATATQEIARG
jgi:hypothetical protein